MVILENQVVLVISDVEDPAKISRLKTALEDERIVAVRFFDVVRLQLGVISVYLLSC